MAEFIFVRHGQSQANANGIIADAHPPLTQQGIDQARSTAAKVCGLNIQLIVCSPLLRAQQTAEIIAGELGIDLSHVQIIDDLRERGLGELEGKPKAHDSLWYYSGNNAAGVETTVALYDRMTRCLATLKKLGKERTMLVVGHSVSGFYLLQVAAHRSFAALDAPHQLKNAGFVKVSL